MLPSLEHRLTLASTAEADNPFTIVTPRCIVLGRERTGIWEILLDGVSIARDFDITDVSTLAFRMSPLGVERTLRAGPATITERIVAAAEAPAVAVEWSTDHDTRLHVKWSAPEKAAAFLFSRPVAIEQGEALIVLDAGEAVQLIISGDVDGASDYEPTTWVQQHTAAAEQRDHEWLRADFPEDDLTSAFEWAKLRLAAMHRVESPRPPLALVGVGDFRKARAHLDELATAQDYLLLTARYFAASGDDAFVRSRWDYTKELYARSANRSDADTLRELAATAESIGDAEFAGELTRFARSRMSTPLPWWDFESGKTAAAVRHWAETARLCFEGEMGAWPEDERASAAGVVASFAYGLLGYAPDAARGRLRLRPQIPENWDRLAVHNIRIGDAAVSLEYERAGTVARYTMTQTAGAVPVRLILEPALTAQYKRCFVDGTEAQLDMEAFGERIIVPVQIMLDDRRVVEIHLPA